MPIEPGGSPPRQEPAPGARIRTLREGEKYDPAPDRENTRSWLAKALVWLLFLISLGLLAGVMVGELSSLQAKDLALAVLSPLVALTGAALGFYFGGDERGN